MTKVKCQVADCENPPRYIVGIGKLEVCIDCFDRLPDVEKAELYSQKLVIRI